MKANHQGLASCSESLYQNNTGDAAATTAVGTDGGTEATSNPRQQTATVAEMEATEATVAVAVAAAEMTRTMVMMATMTAVPKEWAKVTTTLTAASATVVVALEALVRTMSALAAAMPARAVTWATTGAIA